MTAGVGFGVPLEALVTVQPRVMGTFHVASTNLTVVVTTPQEVSILIQRSDGLQTMAQVNYNTTQPRQPVIIGGLNFEPAQPQVHYTRIGGTAVTFNPGDASHLITIPVLAIPDMPRAFFVQISSTGQYVT